MVAQYVCCNAIERVVSEENSGNSSNGYNDEPQHRLIANTISHIPRERLWFTPPTIVNQPREEHERDNSQHIIHLQQLFYIYMRG